jgi:hypothetical protein
MVSVLTLMLCSAVQTRAAGHIDFSSVQRSIGYSLHVHFLSSRALSRALPDMHSGACTVELAQWSLLSPIPDRNSCAHLQHLPNCIANTSHLRAARTKLTQILRDHSDGASTWHACIRCRVDHQLLRNPRDSWRAQSINSRRHITRP